MNKIIKTIIAATTTSAMLFLTSCELPIDDGTGGGGGGDKVEEKVYSGLISEFELDIDKDGINDIEAHGKVIEKHGIRYMCYYFNTNDNTRLLAHGTTYVTGAEEVDKSVVESVEGGAVIVRGLEQMLYNIDYYYNPEHLATAMPLNLDAAIPKVWDGPLATNKGYMALMIQSDEGPNFGWIEYELDVTPIWKNENGGSDVISSDANFTVTDMYLNPTMGEKAIAGEK